MQLRGSKQAIAAGGAAIAVLAMAACSSSSSSSTSTPAATRRRPRAGIFRVECGRGERHHQRGRLHVPANFQQAAISGVQVGAAGHHRQLLRRSARARAAPTCTRTPCSSPAPTRPIPATRAVQGSRGQDGAVLPGDDRPDRRRVQPVRRHRPASWTRRPSRSIFQGKITTWNDPAIKALNPGVSLPGTTITLGGPLGLLRHDGELLPVPARRPRAAPGRSAKASTIKWPSTAHAGAGNNGVAQVVKSTPGAIGYVDFSTATASGLSAASIKNSAGSFVAPSAAGATAAASHVTPAADLTFAAVDAAGCRLLPDHLPVVGPGVRAAAERQRRRAAQGLLRLPARRGQQLLAHAQPRAAAVEPRPGGRRAAEQDHRSS